jgi:hypothetical protein
MDDWELEFFAQGPEHQRSYEAVRRGIRDSFSQQLFESTNAYEASGSFYRLCVLDLHTTQRLNKHKDRSQDGTQHQLN